MSFVAQFGSVQKAHAYNSTVLRDGAENIYGWHSNFKGLLSNNTETMQLFFAPFSVVFIHYQQPHVLLEGFCFKQCHDL